MRSFNPRARTGRDALLHRTTSPSASFNPRARTGRDCAQACTVTVQHVSIHAPARGATEWAKTRRGLVAFQSTRPHGARRMTDPHAISELLFQSTRPHGARHGRSRCCRIDRRVSIHAPARGATGPSRLGKEVFIVSIHAPARGATPIRLLLTPATPVSIHAPARGATCCRWRKAGSPGRFNPRARTGRDWTLRMYSSALPSFNPRARTGRDGMLITQPYHCKKSFAIANLRALSRKNGKDHDRRSDASAKTTACRNANLRGGQRSLGVRGTRAGAANCGRGTR